MPSIGTVPQQLGQKKKYYSAGSQPKSTLSLISTASSSTALPTSIGSGSAESTDSSLSPKNFRIRGGRFSSIRVKNDTTPIQTKEIKISHSESNKKILDSSSDLESYYHPLSIAGAKDFLHQNQLPKLSYTENCFNINHSAAKQEYAVARMPGSVPERESSSRRRRRSSSRRRSYSRNRERGRSNRSRDGSRRRRRSRSSSRYHSHDSRGSRGRSERFSSAESRPMKKSTPPGGRGGSGRPDVSESPPPSPAYPTKAEEKRQLSERMQKLKAQLQSAQNTPSKPVTPERQPTNQSFTSVDFSASSKGTEQKRLPPFPVATNKNNKYDDDDYYSSSSESDLSSDGEIAVREATERSRRNSKKSNGFSSDSDIEVVDITNDLDFVDAKIHSVSPEPASSAAAASSRPRFDLGIANQDISQRGNNQSNRLTKCQRDLAVAMLGVTIEASQRTNVELDVLGSLLNLVEETGQSDSVFSASSPETLNPRYTVRFFEDCCKTMFKQLVQKRKDAGFFGCLSPCETHLLEELEKVARVENYYNEVIDSIMPKTSSDLFAGSSSAKKPTTSRPKMGSPRASQEFFHPAPKKKASAPQFFNNNVEPAGVKKSSTTELKSQAAPVEIIDISSETTPAVESSTNSIDPLPPPAKTSIPTLRMNKNAIPVPPPKKRKLKQFGTMKAKSPPEDQQKSSASGQISEIRRPDLQVQFHPIRGVNFQPTSMNFSGSALEAQEKSLKIMNGFAATTTSSSAAKPVKTPLSATPAAAPIKPVDSPPSSISKVASKAASLLSEILPKSNKKTKNPQVELATPPNELEICPSAASSSSKAPVMPQVPFSVVTPPPGVPAVDPVDLDLSANAIDRKMKELKLPSSAMPQSSSSAAATPKDIKKKRKVSPVKWTNEDESKAQKLKEESELRLKKMAEEKERKEKELIAEMKRSRGIIGLPRFGVKQIRNPVDTGQKNSDGVFEPHQVACGRIRTVVYTNGFTSLTFPKEVVSKDGMHVSRSKPIVDYYYIMATGFPEYIYAQEKDCIHELKFDDHVLFNVTGYQTDAGKKGWQAWNVRLAYRPGERNPGKTQFKTWGSSLPKRWVKKPEKQEDVLIVERAARLKLEKELDRQREQRNLPTPKSVPSSEPTPTKLSSMAALPSASASASSRPAATEESYFSASEQTPVNSAKLERNKSAKSNDLPCAPQPATIIDVEVNNSSRTELVAEKLHRFIGKHPGGKIAGGSISSFYKSCPEAQAVFKKYGSFSKFVMRFPKMFKHKISGTTSVVTVRDLKQQRPVHKTKTKNLKSPELQQETNNLLEVSPELGNSKAAPPAVMDDHRPAEPHSRSERWEHRASPSRQRSTSSRSRDRDRKRSRRSRSRGRSRRSDSRNNDDGRRNAAAVEKENDKKGEELFYVLVRHEVGDTRSRTRHLHFGKHFGQKDVHELVKHEYRDAKYGLKHVSKQHLDGSVPFGYRTEDDARDAVAVIEKKSTIQVRREQRLRLEGTRTFYDGKVTVAALYEGQRVNHSSLSPKPATVPAASVPPARDSRISQVSDDWSPRPMHESSLSPARNNNFNNHGNSAPYSPRNQSMSYVDEEPTPNSYQKDDDYADRTLELPRVQNRSNSPQRRDSKDSLNSSTAARIGNLFSKFGKPEDEKPSEPKDESSRGSRDSALQRAAKMLEQKQRKEIMEGKHSVSPLRAPQYSRSQSRADEPSLLKRKRSPSGSELEQRKSSRRERPRSVSPHSVDKDASRAALGNDQHFFSIPRESESISSPRENETLRTDTVEGEGSGPKFLVKLLGFPVSKRSIYDVINQNDANEALDHVSMRQPQDQSFILVYHTYNAQQEACLNLNQSGECEAFTLEDDGSISKDQPRGSGRRRRERSTKNIDASSSASAAAALPSRGKPLDQNQLKALEKDLRERFLKTWNEPKRRVKFDRLRHLAKASGEYEKINRRVGKEIEREGRRRRSRSRSRVRRDGDGDRRRRSRSEDSKDKKLSKAREMQRKKALAELTEGRQMRLKFLLRRKKEYKKIGKRLNGPEKDDLEKFTRMAEQAGKLEEIKREISEDPTDTKAKVPTPEPLRTELTDGQRQRLIHLIYLQKQRDLIPAEQRDLKLFQSAAQRMGILMEIFVEVETFAKEKRERDAKRAEERAMALSATSEAGLSDIDGEPLKKTTAAAVKNAVEPKTLEDLEREREERRARIDREREIERQKNELLREEREMRRRERRDRERSRSYDDRSPRSRGRTTRDRDRDRGSSRSRGRRERERSMESIDAEGWRGRINSRIDPEDRDRNTKKNDRTTNDPTEFSRAKSFSPDPLRQRSWNPIQKQPTALQKIQAWRDVLKKMVMFYLDNLPTEGHTDKCRLRDWRQMQTQSRWQDLQADLDRCMVDYLHRHPDASAMYHGLGDVLLEFTGDFSSMPADFKVGDVEKFYVQKCIEFRDKSDSKIKSKNHNLSDGKSSSDEFMDCESPHPSSAAGPKTVAIPISIMSQPEIEPSAAASRTSKSDTNIDIMPPLSLETVQNHEPVEVNFEFKATPSSPPLSVPPSGFTSGNVSRAVSSGREEVTSVNNDNNNGTDNAHEMPRAPSHPKRSTKWNKNVAKPPAVPPSALEMKLNSNNNNIEVQLPPVQRTESAEERFQRLLEQRAKNRNDGPGKHLRAPSPDVMSLSSASEAEVIMDGDVIELDKSNRQKTNQIGEKRKRPEEEKLGEPTPTAASSGGGEHPAIGAEHPTFGQVAVSGGGYGYQGYAGSAAASAGGTSIQDFYASRTPPHSNANPILFSRHSSNDLSPTMQGMVQSAAASSQDPQGQPKRKARKKLKRLVKKTAAPVQHDPNLSIFSASDTAVAQDDPAELARAAERQENEQREAAEKETPEKGGGSFRGQHLENNLL